MLLMVCKTAPICKKRQTLQGKVFRIALFPHENGYMALFNQVRQL